MEQPTASRRLVKSPPELWEELSRADLLGRHLAEFGEIRITRIIPETTVAWEGDRVSGTVEIAPAGWGTQVTLTANPSTAADGRPANEQPESAVTAAAPACVPVEMAPHGGGLLARLFRRPPDTQPQAAVPDADRTLAILGDVLEGLGAAHHRPFSRD